MNIVTTAGRILVGAMLAIVVAACQPSDGESTPTVDTAGSGAPLNPGGVEPSEPQDEIDDEGD